MLPAIELYKYIRYKFRILSCLGQRKKSDIMRARIILSSESYGIVRVVIRSIKVVTVKDGDGEKESMTA